MIVLAWLGSDLGTCPNTGFWTHNGSLRQSCKWVGSRQGFRLHQIVKTDFVTECNAECCVPPFYICVNDPESIQLAGACITRWISLLKSLLTSNTCGDSLFYVRLMFKPDNWAFHPPLQRRNLHLILTYWHIRRFTSLGAFSTVQNVPRRNSPITLPPVQWFSNLFTPGTPHTRFVLWL